MPLDVLRDRSGGDAPAVTTMELFFDLVYVFAVTQLSHHLLLHLDGPGALEALVLLAAVWWAWNYTTWATNWIDPERAPVRALMVVLMLISLVMSAAIPEAFGDRALAFAIAYAAIQVVRSAFMAVALRGQVMGRNYFQLMVWTAIAGAVWIGGAFADGNLRLAIWIVALAIDYAAPVHGFALPRLGRTAMRDWTLLGGHLAERCQLLVIVALGETVLVTGAAFSDLDASASVVTAFVIGFLVCVALWWVYFVRYAAEGADIIARADDPTRVGRAAYAYAHAVMVGGIIVAAVGIELTIDHPTGDMHVSTAATILGGPALYLAGNALFNYSLSHCPPWSRLVGIAALAPLVPVAVVANPLTLSALAMAVVLALAVLTGSPRRVSVAEPAPA